MLEKYQFWVLVQDSQQVGKEWYRKDSFLLLWMITLTTVTTSYSYYYYYYLGDIRGGWWGWGTSQYFVKRLHLRKASCPTPTCLGIPQYTRTKTSEGEGSRHSSHDCGSPGSSLCREPCRQDRTRQRPSIAGHAAFPQQPLLKTSKTSGAELAVVAHW